MDTVLSALRTHADAYAARSYSPYTLKREAVILLLADGSWVPGVRVENASFSLTISAAMNAVTTALAAERDDVLAAVSNVAWPTWEQAYIRTLFPTLASTSPDGKVLCDPQASLGLGERIDPFLGAPEAKNLGTTLALTRRVARAAYIPESDFPVGCVLETSEGRLLPGVNVEHPDWSRILCAERSALGTAVTWQVPAIRQVYISCPKDEHGSPCGACRQVLHELAPSATIWMDRGTRPAEKSDTATLLPGSFDGTTLTR